MGCSRQSRAASPAGQSMEEVSKTRRDCDSRVEDLFFELDCLASAYRWDSITLHGHLELIACGSWGTWVALWAFSSQKLRSESLLSSWNSQFLEVVARWLSNEVEAHRARRTCVVSKGSHKSKCSAKLMRVPDLGYKLSIARPETSGGPFSCLSFLEVINRHVNYDCTLSRSVVLTITTLIFFVNSSLTITIFILISVAFTQLTSSPAPYLRPELLAFGFETSAISLMRLVGVQCRDSRLSSPGAYRYHLTKYLLSCGVFKWRFMQHTTCNCSRVVWYFMLFSRS